MRHLTQEQKTPLCRTIKFLRCIGLCLTLSFLLPTLLARAATPGRIAGPSLAVERLGARDRYEAKLVAPIPMGLLGGLFILRGHHAHEALNLDTKSSGVSSQSIGLTYLPHAKEGAPRFYLQAARYGLLVGAPAEGSMQIPMGEYEVGTYIADDDLPFALKLHPSDEATTHLAVQLRQFPGFRRPRVLLGHMLKTTQGFIIDITYPTHALLGWTTRHEEWFIYTTARRITREYQLALGSPGDSSTQALWADGDSTQLVVGIKRRIQEPFFLTLEAGRARDRLHFISATGEEVLTHTSEYAVFARLALSTWFKTP